MATAGDVFGTDTQQVSDDLNAIEYYAGDIVEKALKHKTKPVSVSDMKADNVGDILIKAATGKAATRIQPRRLPFGQFADLLKATADYLGAYYTLTREADTMDGGQCMAATFTTEGKPGDVLGIVYFDAIIAPTITNLTAIETAIKGL